MQIKPCKIALGGRLLFKSRARGAYLNKSISTDAEYLITDPESHPNVVLIVPDGVTAIGLSEEGYYSDTIVRCSFCRQRQPHRKGFFANLSDGTRALCGHCCAVQLTSKQTVARIEKVTNQKIAVAKEKKLHDVLKAGGEDLLNLLEAEFLPIELEIRNIHKELIYRFPDIWEQPPNNFAIAAGGIRTIKSQILKKMTNSKVDELLKKKIMVRKAIEKGVYSLEKTSEFLSDGSLGSRFPNICKKHGYEDYSFKNRVLRVKKRNVHQGEYVPWNTQYKIPNIEVPDTIKLFEKLDAYII